MKVAVGSNNPVKKQAVHNVFEVFREARQSWLTSHTERVRARVAKVDFGVDIEFGRPSQEWIASSMDYNKLMDYPSTYSFTLDNIKQNSRFTSVDDDR
jgi:non-canonical (house-cleaning) NTP pyrophosphatase